MHASIKQTFFSEVYRGASEPATIPAVAGAPLVALISDGPEERFFFEDFLLTTGPVGILNAAAGLFPRPFGACENYLQVFKG